MAEYNIKELLKNGTLLYKQENYEEALQCYDKILEIEPENFRVLNYKGNILYNQGKYEKALKCLIRALEINSESSNGWFTRGEILIALGDYEEAMKCLNKALEIEPGDIEAWYNRGNILIIMESYEEALKCYNKALELNPENEFILELKKDLLMTLKSMGKTQIEYYDKASQIVSTSLSPSESWKILKMLWKQMYWDEKKISFHNKLIKLLVEKNYISSEVAEILNLAYETLSRYMSIKKKDNATPSSIAHHEEGIINAGEEIEKRLLLIKRLTGGEEKYITEEKTRLSLGLESLKSPQKERSLSIKLSAFEASEIIIDFIAQDPSR